ncbi:MAG TPA: DUF805 domain-containing protein [Candidatus Woesebacteria bacterium]|nr:DUF805 domain-containing protein [Candidatus Woesebacteria bacterium]
MFDGRIGRLYYFIFSSILIATGMVAYYLIPNLYISIFFSLLTLPITFKRLHDLGLPGYLAPIGLGSYFGGYFLLFGSIFNLYLIFKKGETVKNKYGPPDDRGFIKAIFTNGDSSQIVHGERIDVHSSTKKAKSSKLSFRVPLIILVVIVLLALVSYLSYYLGLSHQRPFEENVVLDSEKVQASDNFKKKIECTKYFDKIKIDLEIREEKVWNGSMPERGFELFQTGFYSPKLDTCLYVTTWTGIRRQIFGAYVVYDAFTEQKLKSFSDEQKSDYVKYIKEYSGDEQ